MSRARRLAEGDPGELAALDPEGWARGVRLLPHAHRLEAVRRPPLAWRYRCTIPGCDYRVDCFAPPRGARQVGYSPGVP